MRSWATGTYPGPAADRKRPRVASRERHGARGPDSSPTPRAADVEVASNHCAATSIRSAGSLSRSIRRRSAAHTLGELEVFFGELDCARAPPPSIDSDSHVKGGVLDNMGAFVAAWMPMTWTGGDGTSATPATIFSTPHAPKAGRARSSARGAGAGSPQHRAKGAAESSSLSQ